MRKSNDTYKEVRTFTFPNCTARVYFPDISDEERQRRMKRIEQAAANLLRSTLKKTMKSNM